MRRLLFILFLLAPMAVCAQLPIWRNPWSTNQAPPVVGTNLWISNTASHMAWMFFNDPTSNRVARLWDITNMSPSATGAFIANNNGMGTNLQLYGYETLWSGDLSIWAGNIGFGDLSVSMISNSFNTPIIFPDGIGGIMDHGGIVWNRGMAITNQSGTDDIWFKGVGDTDWFFSPSDILHLLGTTYIAEGAISTNFIVIGTNFASAVAELGDASSWSGWSGSDYVLFKQGVNIFGTDGGQYFLFIDRPRLGAGADWFITSNDLSGFLGTLSVPTQYVGTLILTNPMSVSSGGTGLTNVGSAGQVLTSDGTGMAWSNAAAGGGAFIGNNLGFGTNTTLYGLTNNGLAVFTNGNVGIGTNNPQSPIHIFGSNATGPYILQVGTYGYTNAFTISASTADARMRGGLQAGSLTSEGGVVASSILRMGTIWYMESSGSSRLMAPTNGTWKMTDQGGSVLLSSNRGATILFEPVQALPFPSASVGVLSNKQWGVGNTNGTLTVFTSTNGTTRQDILEINPTNVQSSGTLIASNGFVNQVKTYFTTNYTLTGNEGILCPNGTNQVITLPNPTNVVGKIFRFASTNRQGSFVLTNIYAGSSIRDGSSQDFKQVGIGSPSFFSDGTAWWPAARTKIIMPCASWSTSTNIPLVNAAGTSNFITYDTLEFNNSQGINLVSDSQIWITNAGTYQIMFSAMTYFANNNDSLLVWLQNNGTNWPRSATFQSIGAVKQTNVMTVAYFVPVTTPTYFRLAGRASNVACGLAAIAADATVPACPSIIVTVNRVSDPYP